MNPFHKLILFEDSEEYFTTYEDCFEWFDIINEKVFYGKLPPIDTFEIGWRRKYFAYYECFSDPKDETYSYTKICMNKKYNTKRKFVEILAHEMVHHCQFINGETPHHGKSFLRWKTSLKQKGLKLVDKYEEHS